ncbi:hypothetical protein I4641_20710 [Waterburya agarophytonicola K14]|uniref:Uncharacterized protein n=1 Tax=Waterburya agarophytonicola KI4 TaxID=2874699 RepID=A0A964BYG0_9CYAN|nr:HpsJ family protein [Waterburya agarophytonicola]MCC0179386.1 hypothetical protein [Waterburya agarophytonicola KI4]
MLKFRLWQLRKSIQSNSQTSLSSKRVNIAVEQKSTRIINLAGYVILFLVLLDRLFLLSSSQFFDPNWAYNTAGNLVDNVWGLLLGTLLIFYRRDQDLIKPIEYKFLSFLSWFILIIGISYFLITPIILGNAFRIYRTGQTQVISQVDLQKTQIQDYTQKLEGATPEQLNALLQNYQQQNSRAEVKTTEQLKIALVNQAKQTQLRNQTQLETTFNQQTKALIKSTTKWLIGAIISGVFFVLTWRYTAWTRVGY